MIYLFDVYMRLWQSLFGENLTERSIIELLAVVSVIGTVGWIVRIIGKIPIFKGGKKN